jgi:rSAM/selenodomain-associated transferase 2
MSRPPLSIIIPTFNAMPRLVDCLSALVSGVACGLVRELIVVDATSTDQTAHLAADMGCQLIPITPEQRGRGAQLQVGGKAAVGEWLLFLHADSVMQAGWEEDILRHLSMSPSDAAYFTLAFDQDGAGPRRVAGLANLRARVFGLPYGDQGLLISRALYDSVGGFGNLALMEDVNLVRRLGKSRMRALQSRVHTSGAKFARGGWWIVPSRNLLLLAAYFVGVKPETLARWYK